MAEPSESTALMAAVRQVTDFVSAKSPAAAGGLLVGVADLEGLGELREPARRNPSRTRTERLSHFERGDLLLSVGRAEQPKVWLADRDGFCTSSLTVLRPTGKHDPRQLLWSLRALCVSRAGSRIDPRRERVELPQAVGDPRVAVDVLDQIDAAMRLRRQTLVSVERLGPALFHDRLGDPLDRIGGRWPLCKLGGLIEKIEPGWSPKCIDHPASDDDWGVIKVSAVSSGRFRAQENKTLPMAVKPREQLALKAGDLLMVRSNTRALVGATAVVPEDYPRLLLSDKVWRLRLHDDLDARFMKATLSYPSVRQRLSAIATGNIASMQNLTQHKLSELSVMLPPADLQAEHVVDLALLDRVEDAHRRQLGLLEQLLRVVLASSFAVAGADIQEQITIERALFHELSTLQQSIWLALVQADGALTMPELGRRLQPRARRQPRVDEMRQALDLLTAAGAATHLEDARSQRWEEARPYELAESP
jgi:type I restriction enzyme S subunit